MTIGPFLFGAPLALLGLLALPVIWWILRATPPTPKDAELPSMRLLEGVDPREETPARTPWWILLLRMAAAGLALAGLSQPIYAPGAQSGEVPPGPVLIVLDDGWTSASRWPELLDAAKAALDGTSRDTDIHLLTTATRTRSVDPALRLSRQEAERRLASLEPAPWTPDRARAGERLADAGIRPARILFATDGLDPETGTPFATTLSGYGDLAIYAAPPRGPMAISALSVDADAAEVTVERTVAEGEARVYVSALTLDGDALATAEAEFAARERSAQARFELPPAALSRISRFAITGRETAGATWLWDSTTRARRVGLVSAGDDAQPLLSDLHYVRKALEPFASLTEGTLTELIDDAPDAIIATDIGQIASTDVETLRAWIESGGALIRFAGPRLASQGDELLPTPLRRSSRALGGALDWDEPQKLAPFPETSPFAGLTVPANVRVRQQVLAQPAADLQTKTWARLEDGSPLVTADTLGAGSVILFHITAGPAWSDLSYSATFVEMLRRAIAAGRGEAVVETEGAYTPRLVLDAYGTLRSPDDFAAPLQAEDFGRVAPSEIHPPGYYQGPAGVRTINAADNYAPLAITAWPPAARLLGDAEATSTPLAGWLLALAIALLAIDLIVALSVAGRLPRIGRTATGAVLVFAATFGLPETHAQEAEIASPKAIEAALDLRLAYVATRDAKLDEATRAGLEGLSRILFLRTSVEPAETHALDLERDALNLYPMIFYAVPDGAAPLSDQAVARLNAYLREGGSLVIDTRRGGTVGTQTDVESLDSLLAGLDAPPLAPAGDEHVLTKSFYLLDGFPGRYDNRRLWIEATGEERRGDGVSRLFIGDADWAAAWASDERGRPRYSVDGGQIQREMAYRFGVNLVMYVLTGNYKEDQVHIPALLERLSGDQDVQPGDIEIDDLPTNILDGGPR